MSGVRLWHFPIVIVSLSKTPGSRGLKPPAPRCLFHCRIAHCRLSIFHFRAYRRKVSVAVVAVVAVVTVVTVVTVVARWVWWVEVTAVTVVAL